MLNESVREPLVVDISLPNFVFIVNGQKYSLRYDFGAFRVYEKQTGINPLTDKFEINSSNLDLFLWAGLRRNNPEVSLELVQSWLTPITVRGLMDLCGEAYFASFPEVQSDDASVDPLRA